MLERKIEEHGWSSQQEIFLHCVRLLWVELSWYMQVSKTGYAGKKDKLPDKCKPDKKYEYI